MVFFPFLSALHRGVRIRIRILVLCLFFVFVRHL
jgi:hypothetical protein